MTQPEIKTHPGVLAITSELPWPLNTGGHLRSFHILRSLATRFDLRVVTGVDSLSDPGIERLREEGIGVCPVVTGSRRAIGEAARVCGAAARTEPYVMFHRHNRRAVRTEVRRQLELQADVVMTVSAQEQCELQQLGADNVHLVPNGVDCAAFSEFPVGRSEGPPVILYLGALSWQPNVKAAEFLAREAMPEILRRQPDARLTIVGRNPGPDVKSLADLPGVELHANVPDVGEYLRSSTVMAVPLDSGGGTRLKILEAFAAGLPVMSTPIGCEGIECVHGEHLWIAERDRFAATLLDTTVSPQLATEFAERGRALAELTYDWPVVGKLACAAVEAALSDNTQQMTKLEQTRELELSDAGAD